MIERGDPLGERLYNRQRQDDAYREVRSALEAFNGTGDPRAVLQRILDLSDRISYSDAELLAPLVSERLHISKRIFLKDFRADKARYEVLISPPHQASDKKPEPRVAARLPNLIDVVVDNEGSPAFLFKEAGTLQTCKSYTDQAGIEHIPPSLDQWPSLLPRAIEVCRFYGYESGLSHEAADGALFSDVCGFLGRVCDLPDSRYYALLAAWVLHTYLMDSFEYTPIICLFAVPERGKSRTGKALAYLSYRGMVLESLREAHIFRLAENFGATLFFDVMNLWHKAERNNSEDILLQRYERGAKVPRVLWPEKGAFKDTAHFEIFGPTVIATNVPVHYILETRCLVINMPEARRNFPSEVKPEHALPLRERALLFRARHLHDSLPPLDTGVNGRLGDITSPLLQIAGLCGQEWGREIMSLVADVEGVRRMSKAQSIEGKVLLALQTVEPEVRRGVVSLKVVTETLNAERQDRYHISERRVSGLLESLGLKRAGFIGAGQTAFFYEPKEISRLLVAYGLCGPSVTSATS